MLDYYILASRFASGLQKYTAEWPDENSLGSFVSCAFTWREWVRPYLPTIFMGIEPSSPSDRIISVAVVVV